MSGEIGTSNALIFEERFIGWGRDKILADVEQLLWPGLGQVGVRLPGVHHTERDALAQ